jgi:hypothetical protein
VPPELRKIAVLHFARLWLLLGLIGCATTPRASTGPEPLLLSALDPGQAQTSVSGCLAGDKDKSIVRKSNDHPEDDVEVRTVPGGALVIHRLTHPCCLEANVRFLTRGNVATVHERLGGEPCRCVCQSTIETAIGLDLGMWTVRVEVEQPFAAARIAGERRVKILEPKAETIR